MKRTSGGCDEDLLGGDGFPGAFLAVLLVVARRTLKVLLVMLRPERRRRPRWRDVDGRYYVVCEEGETKRG